MAIKLERVVKTYYDKLEEGKVLGRKCPRCGNVEWPPVYACNACGAMETEWCEMSGRGTIVELYMTTPMNAKAAYADMEPYAYAWVKCEEGPERQVMVHNITRQNEGYVRAHMPYPIQMEIVQRDGYKTAVFKIDPIDENGNPIQLEAPAAKKAAAPKAEAAPAASAVAYCAATLETLKGLVADSYHVDVSTLGAETSFEKELKAPSVILVGLIAKLEDEFDEMISITEASAAKTLGELAALVDKIVGNEPDTVMGGGGPAPAAAVKSGGPESKTLAALKKLAAKSYHKDESELNADSSFEKELKAPSVTLVGLIAKLEDEFDVMISITKASAAKTLGELADIIDQLISEG